MNGSVPRARCVRASEFHFPCWELGDEDSLDGDTFYIVWAPGPIRDQGRQTGAVREQWAASWDADGGRTGDLRRGQRLDDVLAIFPAGVAAAFRAVIDDWTTSAKGITT